jgi:hypothetical protein
MAVKIQFRRDTASNWSAENPILSQGEMGLDTTNVRFKLGDGSTAWNNLPFAVDFQPDGTYPDLRAQGTTAEDVGLGNVTNESKNTMFTDPTFTGTVNGVTATMVGLGNVTNESKATMFTNPTFTGTVIGVSKQHVGLGNVTNDAQIPLAQKGQPSGVATLDGAGLVPANQLPSYVDDVLEFADLASFPASGEIGKIYVTLDTNKTYRWSGSTYVEISASLVPNDGTLTVQGSNGLQGSGTFTADQSTAGTITLTHADTSTQASVDNSGNNVIQDITLDDYGHVTGLVSKEITNTITATNQNASSSETNLKFWSGTQAQYDQFGIVSIGFENFLPPEENNQALAFGFNVPVDFATAIQKLVIGIGNFDTIIYDKGVYLEGFTSDPNAPAGSLSFLNPDTSIQNPNEFLQFYLTGDFGPAFGTQTLYGTNITSNSVNITSRWDNSAEDDTLYFVTEV